VLPHFALPQRLAFLIDSKAGVHGNGVGGVGLELEGIDPGGGGGINQGQGAGQALVVVARHFGDNKRLVRGANQAAADADFGHGLIDAISGNKGRQALVRTLRVRARTSSHHPCADSQ